MKAVLRLLLVLGICGVSGQAFSRGGLIAGGFFVSAPPTPIFVSFVPASPQISDSSVSGTQVATISITMSDGSQYAGGTPVFCSSGCPPNNYGNGGSLFALVGPANTAIKTAQPLSAANDGTYRSTVKVTQNSVSAWADITVQVVQSGVPVPAAALAAGFTTLARNDDFTSPMPSNWLGCYPPDGSAHQWYQSSSFNPPGPCTISQVTDPKYGGTTLDMVWSASTAGTVSVPVQTMTTESWGSTFATTYGYGYFEALMRADTEPSIPAPGYVLSPGVTAWWSYPRNAQAGQNFEFDFMEHLFEHPTGPDAAIHDWPAANNTKFTYNPITSSYDPSAYHKWGMRVTGDATTGIGVCTYLDDVLTGSCVSFGYTGSEATLRNMLILWSGVLCDFGVNTDCTNAPITNVYNCGGNICLSAPQVVTYNPAADTKVNISGVTGVPANGVWSLTRQNSTDWRLTSSTFSGAYSGGGTFNPYTKQHTYVRYARVWSCANFATTMCYGTILTGAP